MKLEGGWGLNSEIEMEFEVLKEIYENFRILNVFAGNQI